MPVRRRPSSYPKPGPVGGRLIREVVSFLRDNGFDLPISSHILIGVSGGSDSIALAHLLLKYGRRVVAKENLILLHVNHAWRAKKSDEDARFVQAFARVHRAKLITTKLKPPAKSGDYQGRSWEEVAREARKAFFQKEAIQHRAPVFTAHQADDLAETVLWRMLTGTAGTHGGGIAVRHENEVRPLLKIRKAQLLAYLEEENQSYREDETNLEGRFLRSRIRTEIMPAMEQIFSKAVEHLVQLGLDAQKRNAQQEESIAPGILLGAAGLKARRAHWEAIQAGQSEIHLPGGWKLTRKIEALPAASFAGEGGPSRDSRESKKALKNGSSRQVLERWMLERIFQSIS